MYSMEYICTSAETVRTSVSIRRVSELTEIPQLKNWPEMNNHSRTGIMISEDEETEKPIKRNQLKIAASDIKVEEKYCAVFSPNNIPKGYVKIVEIKGRKKSNL
tara:strand:- start:260 stop:571 length:312 start_codon:yes stop_codon:yes gene_type:complete